MAHTLVMEYSDLAKEFGVTPETLHTESSEIACRVAETLRLMAQVEGGKKRGPQMIGLLGDFNVACFKISPRVRQPPRPYRVVRGPLPSGTKSSRAGQPSHYSPGYSDRL